MYLITWYFSHTEPAAWVNTSNLLDQRQRHFETVQSKQVWRLVNALTNTLGRLVNTLGLVQISSEHVKINMCFELKILRHTHTRKIIINLIIYNKRQIGFTKYLTFAFFTLKTNTGIWYGVAYCWLCSVFTETVPRSDWKENVFGWINVCNNSVKLRY